MVTLVNKGTTNTTVSAVATNSTQSTNTQINSEISNFGNTDTSISVEGNINQLVSGNSFADWKGGYIESLIIPLQGFGNGNGQMVGGIYLDGVLVFQSEEIDISIQDGVLQTVTITVGQYVGEGILSLCASGNLNTGLLYDDTNVTLGGDFYIELSSYSSTLPSNLDEAVHDIAAQSIIYVTYRTNIDNKESIRTYTGKEAAVNTLSGNFPYDRNVSRIFDISQNIVIDGIGFQIGFSDPVASEVYVAIYDSSFNLIAQTNKSYGHIGFGLSFFDEINITPTVLSPGRYFVVFKSLNYGPLIISNSSETENSIVLLEFNESVPYLPSKLSKSLFTSQARYQIYLISGSKNIENVSNGETWNDLTSAWSTYTDTWQDYDGITHTTNI